MSDPMDTFASNRREERDRREDRFRQLASRDRDDRDRGRSFFRDDLQTQQNSRGAHFPRNRQRSPIDYEDMDRIPQGGGVGGGNGGIPFIERRVQGNGLLRNGNPDMGPSEMGYSMGELRPKYNYRDRDSRFRSPNSPPFNSGPGVSGHRDYFSSGSGTPYNNHDYQYRYNDDNRLRGSPYSRDREHREREWEREQREREREHRDREREREREREHRDRERDKEREREDRDRGRDRERESREFRDNLMYRPNLASNYERDEGEYYYYGRGGPPRNRYPRDYRGRPSGYPDTNRDEILNYRHERNISRCNSVDSERSGSIISNATKHNCWRQGSHQQKEIPPAFPDFGNPSSWDQSPSSPYRPVRPINAPSPRTVSPPPGPLDTNSEESSRFSSSKPLLKISIPKFSERNNTDDDMKVDNVQAEDETNLNAYDRNPGQVVGQSHSAMTQDELEIEDFIYKDPNDPAENSIEEHQPGDYTTNAKGGWTGWHSFEGTSSTPGQMMNDITNNETLPLDNITEQDMDISPKENDEVSVPDVPEHVNDENVASENLRPEEKEHTHTEDNIASLPEKIVRNVNNLEEIPAEVIETTVELRIPSQCGSLPSNFKEMGNKNVCESVIYPTNLHNDLPERQINDESKGGTFDADDSIMEVTQNITTSNDVCDDLGREIEDVEEEISKFEDRLTIVRRQKSLRQQQKIEKKKEGNNSNPEINSIEFEDDKYLTKCHPDWDSEDQENKILVKKEKKDISIKSRLILPKKLYEENHALIKQNRGKIVPTQIYQSLRDYPFFQKNIEDNANTRPIIFSFILKKRKAIEKKELDLRRQYKVLYEEWIQKLEKLDKQNGKKKKNEKGDAVSGSNFDDKNTSRILGRGNRRSDAVRSEIEFEEIIKNIEAAEMSIPENRAKRTLASIPPMVLDLFHRGPLTFDDRRSLVRNSVDFYYVRQGTLMEWSQKENTLFRDLYVEHPKQFGKIASSIPDKSAKDCIEFYYLNKKNNIDFKALVNKKNRVRNRLVRRRAQGVVASPPTPELPTRRRNKASALLDDIGKATNSRRRNKEKEMLIELSHENQLEKESDQQELDKPPELNIEQPKPRRRTKSTKVDEETEKGKRRKPNRTKKDTTNVVVEEEENQEDAPDTSVVTNSDPSGKRYYWTAAEKVSFEKHFKQYSTDWERISEKMKTKTANQIRNYHSKEFSRDNNLKADESVARAEVETQVDAENVMDADVSTTEQTLKSSGLYQQHTSFPSQELGHFGRPFSTQPMGSITMSTDVPSALPITAKSVSDVTMLNSDTSISQVAKDGGKDQNSPISMEIAPTPSRTKKTILDLLNPSTDTETETSDAKNWFGDKPVVEEQIKSNLGQIEADFDNSIIHGSSASNALIVDNDDIVSPPAQHLQHQKLPTVRPGHAQHQQSQQHQQLFQPFWHQQPPPPQLSYYTPTQAYRVNTGQNLQTGNLTSPFSQNYALQRQQQQIMLSQPQPPPPQNLSSHQQQSLPQPQQQLLTQQSQQHQHLIHPSSGARLVYPQSRYEVYKPTSFPVDQIQQRAIQNQQILSSQITGVAGHQPTSSIPSSTNNHESSSPVSMHRPSSEMNHNNVVGRPPSMDSQQLPQQPRQPSQLPQQWDRGNSNSVAATPKLSYPPNRDANNDL